MPHLPGTPHVMRCGLLWGYGNYGIVCENTFYLQDNTDAIFTAQSTVAGNIFSAAVLTIVPQLYNEIFLNGVVLEDVRTTTFGATVFPQTPTTGTKAGSVNQVPSSVALCVKKVTGNPGRSGRGRWYWPIGDVAGLNLGDNVATAYATAIKAALAAFQTGVEGSVPASSMGIVSYYSNKVLRSAGVFQRITDWQTSDLAVDSQRRRLLGRGR